MDKLFMLSERTQPEVHMLYYSIHIKLYKKQTTMWWQKADLWFSREGAMGRELRRGTEKIFRVMAMFIILVVLMVSQEHIYGKTHQSVHCKYMLVYVN